MPTYLAVMAMALFPCLVAVRTIMLQSSGTKTIHLGSLDKSDYVIPPVMLYYFYAIFAAAFGWPLAGGKRLFDANIVAWLGVALCFGGLAFVLLALISFGRSFRVGIDVDHPDKLVTTGVFAFSRNPIYLGFGAVLIGEFLVFPNWVALAYVPVGIWLFRRQIMREEEFLRQHYGQEYTDYCNRVRRYL